MKFQQLLEHGNLNEAARTYATGLTEADLDKFYTQKQFLSKVKKFAKQVSPTFDVRLVGSIDTAGWYTPIYRVEVGTKKSHSAPNSGTSSGFNVHKDMKVSFDIVPLSDGKNAYIVAESKSDRYKRNEFNKHNKNPTLELYIGAVLKEYI